MQTGLSSHAMGHCKLKPGYFDFTHAKRHHTQKYTYMITNHDINKKYICALTRVSPVVLASSVLASTKYLVLANTSQTKRRLTLSPPCCVLRHGFPRSKGRSKPMTAFSLIVSRSHPFPGSKGRSSATTQVVVVSLLLLLLLLLL